MPQPKVPAWAACFLMGEITLWVDGLEYTCYILKGAYQRQLPFFSGCQGEFIYASEEIPGKFLRYVLAHEIRRAKMGSTPGRYLTCVKEELVEIPYHLRQEYIAFRLQTFHAMREFYRPTPDPVLEEIRWEVAACTSHLECAR